MSELDKIRAIAMRHAGRPSLKLPRLFAYTLDHTTEVDPLIYDPAASLVIQGTQRMFIGDKMFEYGPGQSMIVAAEIAALGQVCEASPDRPFVAIGLYLDPPMLSDLVLEMAAMPELPMESGYGVSTASASLLGAWGRLVELLDRPSEIPVMAQSLEHELMFRLLMGPHGGDFVDMRVPPESPSPKKACSSTSFASVWQVMKTISAVLYFVRRNRSIQK